MVLEVLALVLKIDARPKRYYNNGMSEHRIRRILPIALSIIVVAVAIAALISLARVIFFSGSTTNVVSQADISKEALLSSSADRAVYMTVRGKIVADESFRSYQIQITPSSRKLTTYKGYLDSEITNISLTNNIPAYEQFVYSLYKANLTKGIELTDDNNETRGVCATGYIYSFQILKADKTVKQLWTSTCSGSKGSLTAGYSQISSLFIKQVPDADKLISKLWQ